MSLRTVAVTVGAALLSAFVVAVSIVVWAVGHGAYMEDYCFTRAPEPDGFTEATGSGRGLVFEGPVTVRCRWTHHPDVFVEDYVPLVWGVGCLVALALALAIVWSVALGLRDRTNT